MYMCVYIYLRYVVREMVKWNGMVLRWDMCMILEGKLGLLYDVTHLVSLGDHSRSAAAAARGHT